MRATVAFAHNGGGGVLHLCGLALQRAAGATWPFIPYRGAAPALQDIIGGRIDVMCPSPASSLAMARSGGHARLRRHRQHAARLRAGNPDGGRGRACRVAHFGLGRGVRAQGHAQAR